MNICSISGLAGLRSALQLTSRFTASNVSSFLVRGQRINLRTLKQSSAIAVDIDLVHSLARQLPILFFKNPILGAGSLSFAQTLSPSAVQAPPLDIQQPLKLGGVHFLRSAFSSIPTIRRPFLPPSTKTSQASRGLQKLAMSTLSQPQTPAALDSPLREHRHRPVERLTDRLETPSLDDRSYR